MSFKSKTKNVIRILLNPKCVLCKGLARGKKSTAFKPTDHMCLVHTRIIRETYRAGRVSYRE